MQTSLAFEGAFSVGASNRSKWNTIDQVNFPAPGSYNIPNFKDKPSLPQWKFAKGRRTSLTDKRKNPGPGEYDVIDLPQKIKQNQVHVYSSQKSKPQKKPKNDFKQMKFQSENYKPITPSFSFGYRFPWEIRSETPAPNTYPKEDQEQDDFKRKTTDSWKFRKTGFGSENRLMLRTQQSPGPGEYIVQKKIIEQGPQYSFGKFQRFQNMHIDNFPGPGQFDHKFPFSKSNGFSLGQKLGSSLKNCETDVPGPGAYKPQEISSKANVKIGGAPKGNIIDKETLSKPGPGVYEQTLLPAQLSHLKKCSIGQGKRPPLSMPNEFPGPGRYFKDQEDNKEGSQDDLNLNNSKFIKKGYVQDAPQWSMGQKLKELKKDYTFFPGPGTYDNIEEQQLSQTVQINFTKGPRSNPVLSKNEKVGPGAYNIGGKLAENKYKLSGNKLQILANSQRFPAPKNCYEPGPGSYDIRDTIGNIPAYLKSKKKNNGLLDFN